jgi:hypothetical protein
MSKAARKRNSGLTVVTQDVADLLGTNLGHAMVPNTQILLKQASQAIDTVGDTFGLTAGERRLLMSTRTSHGLLISGTNRTAFEAVSSQTQHLLCTTDPEFVASLEHACQNCDVRSIVGFSCAASPDQAAPGSRRRSISGGDSMCCQAERLPDCQFSGTWLGRSE